MSPTTARPCQGMADRGSGGDFPRNARLLPERGCPLRADRSPVAGDAGGGRWRPCIHTGEAARTATRPGLLSRSEHKGPRPIGVDFRYRGPPASLLHVDGRRPPPRPVRRAPAQSRSRSCWRPDMFCLVPLTGHRQDRGKVLPHLLRGVRPVRQRTHQADCLAGLSRIARHSARLTCAADMSAWRPAPPETRLRLPHGCPAGRGRCPGHSMPLHSRGPDAGRSGTGLPPPRGRPVTAPGRTRAAPGHCAAGGDRLAQAVTGLTQTAKSGQRQTATGQRSGVPRIVRQRLVSHAQGNVGAAGHQCCVRDGPVLGGDAGRCARRRAPRSRQQHRETETPLNWSHASPVRRLVHR